MSRALVLVVYFIGRANLISRNRASFVLELLAVAIGWFTGSQFDVSCGIVRFCPAIMIMFVGPWVPLYPVCHPHI